MARRHLLGISLVVGAVTMVTALGHVGVVAVDDYDCGMAAAIPADQPTLARAIDLCRGRSPLGLLALSALGRAMLGLGVTDPWMQLRGVQGVLGLAWILLHGVAALVLWKRAPWGGPWSPSLNMLTWVVLTLGGLGPWVATRPMLEAMAAPWLTLSAVLASDYYRRPSVDGNVPWLLAGAVSTLAVAAALRYQTGICALVLVVLVFIRRSRKEWLLGAAVSVAWLLALGCVDAWIKGQGFLGAFVEYVSYNVRHSHEYGQSPWYVYWVVLAGACAPFWLLAPRNSRISADLFSQLVVPIGYLGVFVGAHTLVAHKEERFLLPVAGLWLLACVPWVYSMWRTTWRWRLVCLAVGHAILGGLLALGGFQNNVVGIMAYVKERPEIATLVSIGETLNLVVPTALAGRTLAVESVSLAQAMGRASEGACDQLVLVREDLAKQASSEADDPWMPVAIEAVFEPSLLERLAITGNPRHNIRRSTIYALQRGPGCAATKSQ